MSYRVFKASSLHLFNLRGGCEWMVMANEYCVLDALKVMSLDLNANTIVTKVKVACGAVGIINIRLSREFLPTEF